MVSCTDKKTQCVSCATWIDSLSPQICRTPSRIFRANQKIRRQTIVQNPAIHMNNMNNETPTKITEQTSYTYNNDKNIKTLKRTTTSNACVVSESQVMGSSFCHQKPPPPEADAVHDPRTMVVHLPEIRPQRRYRSLQNSREMLQTVIGGEGLGDLFWGLLPAWEGQNILSSFQCGSGSASSYQTLENTSWFSLLLGFVFAGLETWQGRWCGWCVFSYWFGQCQRTSNSNHTCTYV